MKKKVYTPPVLKELSEEQAKKLVTEGKPRNEEEAAEFLKSLEKRRQKDTTHQPRKPSA